MKSTKTKSIQVSMATTIDLMRLEILQIEAETQQIQAVYTDLVEDLKAKLEQRIKEVKEGDQIQPLADPKAANLATEQEVKALEQKLDIAQIANEQLNLQLEALQAQNLQLESQCQQLRQTQIESQNQLASAKSEAQQLKQQL